MSGAKCNVKLALKLLKRTRLIVLREIDGRY